MKTIVGAAIGNCVHVAGLYHFMKLAESEGYQTKILGGAIPVTRIVEAVRHEMPTILAISYRLTPEVAGTLFTNLDAELRKAGIRNLRMIFGGTPSVATVAKDTGMFEKVFGGEESPDELRHYLAGIKNSETGGVFSDTLCGRIEQKYPYPLIRHHFGRPSLEETLRGIEVIANSGVVDVISIGPDQNAQEHFFRPYEMDPAHDGAGGVPLRHPEDLRALYQKSRVGNFPLLRCYAGTNDLQKWAEMSVETIHNAWAAIPLCWYSEIDNRSTRTIEEAIAEHQKVMRWYAQQGIPVEVNESHQWSLRDAHDSLAVAMAFLAAYNARKSGVGYYVSQFMMNTPPGTSPEMDLAKMLAKKSLIGELADDNFTVFREVRAGLSHFSPDPFIAKGQLASSAVIGLALKPHIYHVVGFSEGDHATLPEELIESCKIVHGVIRNCLHGMPDLTTGTVVTQRKDELVQEARDLLKALWDYGKAMSDDPWYDPRVISSAVKCGMLDTPHFQSNPVLSGRIRTRLIDGAWYAYDELNNRPLTEKERTKAFLS